MKVGSGGYNDPQDLRRELRFTGKEFNDVDLQSKLEQAQRKVDMNVGSVMTEGLFVYNHDVLEFNLNFRQIIQVDEVRLLNRRRFRVDETVIPEGLYELDKDKGRIVFDEEVVKRFEVYGAGERRDQSVFVVDYVPYMFADLELKYAVLDVVNISVVQTSETQLDSIVSNLREQVNELESDLLLEVSNNGFSKVDYYPR